MTRTAAVGILVGLLLGGCTSADQPCRTGRTGGWFSGWGSGGANAFGVVGGMNQDPHSRSVLARSFFNAVPASVS
jgi:hypothetical protein